MMASARQDYLRPNHSISEGKEIVGADKIWEYYEAHKDELEDLDEYAKKRGLVKHAIWRSTIFKNLRSY